MEAKPRVLIIYTGGTIGMIEDSKTAQLMNVDFDHIDDHVPELRRLNVELNSISFDKAIDSSELSVEHWRKIAETVFDNYAHYEGFVVLHGSDTMAYTASALSFMFDGLTKPIILTGSQLPIGIIRTDGKENLITAIEIASSKGNDGQAIIQEVAVYFDHKLLRGNRSTKDSAENFEAFRSPNYEELASAGVGIKYNLSRLFRPKLDKMSLNLNFINKVAHIKLFPGMDFELYGEVFNPERVDGIVVESFGAGNAPTSDVLKKMLVHFISRGGIVLNISQCNSGSVKQGMYKSSMMFKEVGVMSGNDMTSEAAITKLMLALGEEERQRTKEILLTNMRGELTSD